MRYHQLELSSEDLQDRFVDIFPSQMSGSVSLWPLERRVVLQPQYKQAKIQLASKERKKRLQPFGQELKKTRQGSQAGLLKFHRCNVFLNRL